jgi:uncharacterized protein (TIGR02594 family)
MHVTAFAIAQRFVGVKETPGAASTPIVLAMLRLDQAWPSGDDVAWCSAFVNLIAWLLNLPRSRSLAARSWLAVGQPVTLEAAVAGFDVVVLTRGGSAAQPGAAVLDAPGHVGFFGGLEVDGAVWILGGNQGDGVSLALFPRTRVLGVRRLAAE